MKKTRAPDEAGLQKWAQGNFLWTIEGAARSLGRIFTAELTPPPTFSSTLVLSDSSCNNQDPTSIGNLN